MSGGYRLYLKTSAGEMQFLQRSDSPTRLQAQKSTINSWIRQMGLDIPSKGAELIVVDAADKVITRTGFGATRIRWSPVTEPQMPPKPIVKSALFRRFG